MSTHLRSRRQMERASVQRRLRGVYFQSPALAEKPVRAVNISELGLGLETAGVTQEILPGSIVQGNLMVGRTVAPLQARIIHVNRQLIGLEIVSPSDMLRGAIRSYFEVELAGASIRPVGPAPKMELGKPMVLKFSDGKSNWVELLVTNQKLEQFTANVLGNLLEWKEGGAVYHTQNGRREPIGDFLRGQALKFFQSAEALDRPYQDSLETILLGAADFNS